MTQNQRHIIKDKCMFEQTLRSSADNDFNVASSFPNWICFFSVFSSRIAFLNKRERFLLEDYFAQK